MRHGAGDANGGLQNQRLLSKSKWKRKIWQQFESLVRRFTPESIQDLRPVNTMYLISSIVLLSYILAFSLFLSYGYKNSYETQYLVPAAQDTSDDSQICAVQHKEITKLDFYIDTQGYYNGRNGFIYAEAIYNIQFNNIGFDQDAYVSYMETARMNIDAVGARAMNYTLNINILFYLTYKFVQIIGHAGTDESEKEYYQIFSLTADINDIFNPITSPLVFVMSRDHQCLIERIAYFNGPSNTMGLTFNALSYNASSNCTEVLSFGGWVNGLLSPEYYKYFPSINKDINGRFDMRSFVVAHAINVGVYNDKSCAGNITNCFQQSQPPIPLSDGFTVYYYIDSSFEGMDPVQCIKPANATSDYDLFCCISMQGFTGVPILQVNPGLNVNSYSEGPTPMCSCSESNSQLEGCYTNNFFVSLLIYDLNTSSSPDEQNEKTYFPLRRLGLKYVGNYTTLLVDSYNATYPRLREDFGQDASYFDFCYDEPSDVYCRVVTFSTLQYYNYLNIFKRQLFTGSCNNPFSISDASWNRVYNSQPFDFNEKYASCHKSSSMAFVEATGISLANTFSYVPLGASFFAVFYLLYLYWHSENDELAMAAEETDFQIQDQREIMKMISNNLLRELYYRKYGSTNASSDHSRNQDKNVFSSLADMLEKEMSEKYFRNAQYMNSTVETFGRLLDPVTFRATDTDNVHNPISSTSSSTTTMAIANENNNDNSGTIDEKGKSIQIQMRNVAPGFVLPTREDS